MDDRRFDALTRTLATGSTRRGAVRRLAGAAALLAGVFSQRQPAAAHHCSHEGCGCSTGTQHPCGKGLVCCPSSPGTPGGAGVCTPHHQCGPTCIDQGDSCPNHCSRNDGCDGCCTGYCGGHGHCDSPPGLGLACGGGQANPCYYGLVCCSYVPGLAGGAGVCEYRC